MTHKYHPLTHDRHRHRFDKMPQGFMRVRSRKLPVGVSDDTRVEMVIKTATGFGIAGPSKAKMQNWTLAKTELGSVHGYRKVEQTMRAVAHDDT